jgi:hypothetical protein
VIPSLLLVVATLEMVQGMERLLRQQPIAIPVSPRLGQLQRHRGEELSRLADGHDARLSRVSTRCLSSQASRSVTRYLIVLPILK